MMFQRLNARLNNRRGPGSTSAANAQELPPGLRSFVLRRFDPKTPFNCRVFSSEPFAFAVGIGLAGIFLLEIIPSEWSAIAKILITAFVTIVAVTLLYWHAFKIMEKRANVALDKIDFVTSHDALTSLPNLLLAVDRMQIGIASARRTNCKVGLMVLDLDNFKTVNDSLGHSIGDALLTEVSNRLRECVRESDTVCRNGGDEFMIILTDVRDDDGISGVVQKITEQFISPFELQGQSVVTTVSIGITIFPDDGSDFETLQKHAEMAMYSAKEAGRNTYRFFSNIMNTNAREHLQVRNGLHRALGLDTELLLHYQPQIDLVTNRVTGAEALIRWNHPELGMVPPGDFIPVAEDTGLIIMIGEWVLREACRQAKKWHDAGHVGMVIAVNLSPIQFKRGSLEQVIADVLEETGLDPSCLELELTESVLLKDTESVLALMRRLKLLGVKLAIDDFGTGYSSLSYLKRFDVDKLKIDQSFIIDMAGKQDDAAITMAIIQMARSLNLRTIAEGVEDAEVLETLRGYQCDEAQGYYIARPMIAADFEKFLQVSPGHWMQ